MTEKKIDMLSQLMMLVFATILLAFAIFSWFLISDEISVGGIQVASANERVLSINEVAYK